MKLKRFAAAVLTAAFCAVSVPADGIAAALAAEEVSAPEEPVPALPSLSEDRTVIASDDLNNDLTWTLDSDGLLTVEGTGRLLLSGGCAPSFAKYRDKITHAVVGEGVSYISSGVFENLPNLADLTVLDPLCEIQQSNSVIYNYYRNSTFCYEGTITGYRGTPLEAYARKYGFTFIERTPDDEGECGESLTWAFYAEHGLLILCGEGEMTPFSTSADAPWRAHRSTTSRILLPEGLTSISDYAFANSPLLTEVDIPDSVTSIGKGAFSMASWPNRSRLRSVRIGQNVASVGDDAFYRLPALEEIRLSSGNTNLCLEDGILYDTQRKTLLLCPAAAPVVSAALLANTEQIAPHALSHAEALEEVIFPDGLSGIGAEAFESCTSLRSIVLPASLEEIGGEAFCGCKSLGSVVFLGSECTVAEGASTICNYTEEQDYALTCRFLAPPDSAPMRYAESCGRTCIPLTEGTYGTCGKSMIWRLDKTVGLLEILGTGKMDIMTRFPWSESAGEVTTLYLQDGIRTIPRYAFTNMGKLAELRIPDSVTEIDIDAFCMSMAPNDSALRSVIIGKGLETLGTGVFRWHTGLVSFTVSPENKAFCAIDGVLFSKDGKTLVSYPLGRSASAYAVPEGTESIAPSAFAHCPNLRSVTFPDSLRSIGREAFENIRNMPSITLPAGLTYLGKEAFEFCSELTKVEIPAGVTCINRSAFAGTTWLKEQRAQSMPLIINGVVVDGTAIEGACVIPEGVTIIAPSAFSYARSLTAVTLPSTLETVEEQAFYNCEALGEITLSQSVRSIGRDAFGGCKSLTDLTICNPLCAIYPNGESIPSETLTIHGYAGSTAERYAETFSKTFAALDAPGETASGTWGELSWMLDGSGILRISGEGEMPEGTAPWAPYSSGIVKAEIGEGITSISAGAFRDFPVLVNVSLSDTVTTVGERAFRGCSLLSDLTYSYHLVNFGAYALEGTAWVNKQYSYGHKSIIINGTLIDGSAMQGDIEEDLQIVRIAPYALAGNTALTSISLARTVKEIGAHAFDGCSALTELTLSKGLLRIGEAAFRGCAMTSVTIPEGTTGIGRQAFAGCAALRTVEFLASDSCTIYDDASTFCNACTDEGCPFEGTFYGEWKSEAQVYAETYGRQFEGRKRATIYGRCGRQMSWKLDGDDVLTIYGDVEMNDYSKDPAPWADHKWRIERIIIDDGPTTIGQYAFAGCHALTDVTIPATVRSIRDDAFLGCASLTEISLPSGVQQIGEGAFKSTGVSEVRLPYTVTSVGAEAFALCDALKTVTVLRPDCEIGDSPATLCETIGTIRGYRDSTAQAYAETYGRSFDMLSDAGDLDRDGFLTQADAELLQAALSEAIVLTEEQFLAADLDHDGALTSSDYVRLLNKIEAAMIGYLTYELTDEGICITGLKQEVPELLIPQKIDGFYVVSIGDNAFAGHTELRSVTLPEGLTQIGERAFAGCTALAEIGFPKSVTAFGRHAFRGTPWLEECISSNTYAIVNRILIDGSAAKGRIVLPETISVISDYAFAENKALRSVLLPETVKEIGIGAFALCPNLASVTILNKTCSIAREPGVFSNAQEEDAALYTGVLYGYSGSTAEDYARLWDREFRALDGTYPEGDVDFDGEVSQADADLVLEAYSHSSAGHGSMLSPEQCAAADLDHDGRISPSDATYIMWLIPDEQEETTEPAETTIPAETTEPAETTTIPEETTAPETTTTTPPETIPETTTTTSTLPETTETSETTTETTTTEPTETTPPAAADLPGDLNRDGSITASDAALILIAAAKAGATGELPLTEAEQHVADLNGDGSVSASDAALVLMYAAKTGAGYTGTVLEFLAEMGIRRNTEIGT